MYEEYLSAPVQFIIDYLLDFILVEQHYLGLDRNTVGRGSADDGQIPCSQKRKLQCPRDWSGGQGEGID